MWNNFVSSLFDVDISIKQNSTLSSILLALYILLIFEKKLKKKQTLFSSIVTTLFHLYLISLDLW